VRVHLLKEVVPLLEQIAQIVIGLLVETDAVVANLTRLDESEGIKGIVQEAKVMHVPHDVIEFIDID